MPPRKKENRCKAKPKTNKDKKMNSKKVSKFELQEMLLACTRY
jgi:nucleoid DNA-binding protein